MEQRADVKRERRDGGGERVWICACASPYARAASALERVDSRRVPVEEDGERLRLTEAQLRCTHHTPRTTQHTTHHNIEPMLVLLLCVALSLALALVNSLYFLVLNNQSHYSTCFDESGVVNSTTHNYLR